MTTWCDTLERLAATHRDRLHAADPSRPWLTGGRPPVCPMPYPSSSPTPRAMSQSDQPMYATGTIRPASGQP